MRAIFAALFMFGAASSAIADDAAVHRGFLDFDEPLPQGYVTGAGLITLLGPTGMFQNATSGIAAKHAFTVQSCMTFRNNGGDHFHANGVLVEYGVTDWLEIGGLGLFPADLDPKTAGSSELQAGQVNGRVRLMRDQGAMPEVTVGGVGQWGDAPIQFSAVYVAASKGFALSDGPFMKSVRFHAGFREEFPELGSDVSTAYFGLELQVLQYVYLIGEVNTKDDSYRNTPWSLGMQYRSNAFGFSLAVLQNPSDDHLASYVGIGVSY